MLVVVISDCSPSGKHLGESIKLEIQKLNKDLTSLGGLKPIDLNQIEIVDVNQSEIEKNSDLMEKAEIVVADPPLIVSHVHLCKAMKWMHSTYAGVNHIMRNEIPRKDFKLTRLAGFLGPPMAEYVIGQIISHERRFKEFNQHQKNNHWEKKLPYYRTLDQLTLGILGSTGDIGTCIAKAAKSFGMKVKGYARNKRDQIDTSLFEEMFYGKDNLKDLLSKVDYVVSILPSTNETSGLLNGNTLDSCKGSVLINVGRGDVIDEESVLKALDSGWISHAILDVLYKEPLPSSSLLWQREDVTITPHVSALTFPEHVVRSFVDNLYLYTNDKPLNKVVDWNQQY